MIAVMHLPEHAVALESKTSTKVSKFCNGNSSVRCMQQQQGSSERCPQHAASHAPVVLDAGVQRHVIDDADVGEREKDLGGAARQLAVAQNVAVHTAAGEEAVGVDDAVDVVDDVHVDAAAQDRGERRGDEGRVG